MQVSRLVIPDVMLVSPRRLEDKRGFFSEIYNREALRQYGIDAEFIQDNSSLSSRTGTIRGLHFQLAPQAQAKLIMVPRGRIFDVAVDCRKESRTYGQHVSVELSADAWNQLFIPHGFAHGFCTLEPDTTARAAYPELDRDNAPAPHRRACQKTRPMSVLPCRAGKTKPRLSLMTQ